MKVKIFQGHVLDALKQIESNSIDCIITSPPYWGLRDYGEDANTDWGDWHGQLGLEPTLELYLKHMLQITKELKRVLKPTGVMFWNHGDSYTSYYGKHGNRTTKEKWGDRGSLTDDLRPPIPKKIPYKSLCLQNYRLVLRMVDEQGWILRNIIIWHKPNHMPSSVKDRFTNAYEPIFMLVKRKRYWFDLDAVRVPHKLNFGPPSKAKSSGQKWEGLQTIAKHSGYYGPNGELLVNPLGKNPGDVWTIPTQPFPEAHFATFPEKLVEPMIKAGCPKEGIVLDPFMGSGTTAKVCLLYTSPSPRDLSTSRMPSSA